MPDHQVDNNAPVLNEEGQRVMAEGMGELPQPDLLSDEAAQALYNQLYKNGGNVQSSQQQSPAEPSLSPEELPHQSRRYYMNGMEQNNIPQPKVPEQHNFNAEEEQLLSNLGQPSPPETPPQQSQVDLRTQIAMLQDMLAAQQNAKPQPQQAPDNGGGQPPQVGDRQDPPQTPDDAAQQDLLTLDNILQKRFNLRLNDVYQQLAYSNQVAEYIGYIQATQKVEGMKDQLKELWGEQYDYRYNKAQELYKTLPDDQRVHIDSLGIRGAELLWAKAAENESEPEIPSFDRGRRQNRQSSSKDTGVISRDELLAMSEEEYSRQMRPGGRLWNAALQGKVNYGI